MSPDEYSKKIDEIFDSIDEFHSLDAEVLKLLCLFMKCCPSLTHNDEEFLSRKYVLEKVCSVFMRSPLILDINAKKLFITSKLEMEKEDNE